MFSDLLLTYFSNMCLFLFFAGLQTSVAKAKKDEEKEWFLGWPVGARSAHANLMELWRKERARFWISAA
jgi:hypothetical protein